MWIFVISGLVDGKIQSGPIPNVISWKERGFIVFELRQFVSWFSIGWLTENVWEVLVWVVRCCDPVRYFLRWVHFDNILSFKDFRNIFNFFFELLFWYLGCLFLRIILFYGFSLPHWHILILWLISLQICGVNRELQFPCIPWICIS